ACHRRGRGHVMAAFAAGEKREEYKDDRCDKGKSHVAPQFLSWSSCDGKLVHSLRKQDDSIHATRTPCEHFFPSTPENGERPSRPKERFRTQSTAELLPRHLRQYSTESYRRVRMTR